MSDSAISAVINEARHWWALDDATITLVAARENSVYRVESSHGTAALRLHRPGYRNHNEINSELMWMDMLAKNDIPVPNPIPATDAALIKSCAGVSVDVLSWVNGIPLGKSAGTIEIYYELGRLLASTHTLADTWSLPTGFTRPTWDLVGDQPTWGRFWENPMLTPEQATLFLSIRDRAREAMKAIEPTDFGLIHADLVPDNVLCAGNKLQLLDFDDGGFGHRAFDLATITLRSRRKSKSGAFADATIAGYRSARHFEEGVLPVFEALRACSYVGWNISRMHEPGGFERNRRFITEAEDAVRSLFNP